MSLFTQNTFGYLLKYLMKKKRLPFQSILKINEMKHLFFLLIFSLLFFFDNFELN